MWDKGQGGGILLFFTLAIPLAVALAAVIYRLTYVWLHYQ